MQDLSTISSYKLYCTDSIDYVLEKWVKLGKVVKYICVPNIVLHRLENYLHTLLTFVQLWTKDKIFETE